LRSSAVSATVLIGVRFCVFPPWVLDLWPKWCPESEQMGPTSVKKHPKMKSKTANLTPKQVQNDQDGAKMAKKGPGTGFSRFREVFRAKNSSKMEAKMVQKSIKNSIKKRLFFDAGSGSILSDFLQFSSQNGAKMDPNGHQNRSKNRLLSKKWVFAPIQQNKRFWKEKWGSGLRFSRPEATRNQ
jgi:hypothetical protein